MALLEADQLTKRFGDILAVDRASFSVVEGEIFGFLGPNGAGKTTTIHMLTGLVRPTSGRILYQGKDFTSYVKGAQHLMGVVPDESNLYPELTGFENLSFCAALYGMGKRIRETRARELLESFGLAQAGDRRFGGYSKGMKRKLTIAAGIIHNPPILFLDEPTTGIDVAAARQIRQILAVLNQRGTTIFLTTHYIEEAERLCHRIAFIVKGSIERIDTVENLVHPIQGKNVMLLAVSENKPDAPEKLASAFPGLAFTFADGHIRVESETPIGVGPLVRFMEELGVEVAEARRHHPSLEDVFVTITGIEPDAMKKEREKPGGSA